MSKERLVELIEQCVIDNDMPSSEQLADYLIANGVIVPPCVEAKLKENKRL